MGFYSFWRTHLRQEFYWSKFGFGHQDWRAFTHSPFLPQKWTYQLLYVLFRWISALYWMAWVVGSLITESSSYGIKLLLNLTIWGMFLLELYLLTAAISVTVKFIQENFYKQRAARQLALIDLEDPPLPGGCLKQCCHCFVSQEQDTIPFYLQVMWFLFTLSSEVMLPVGLVYWATWDGTVVSWAVNVHEHGLSILPGLIDLFISGIPMRLLHFIYLMMFAATYLIFTVIYWAAGGTNADGDPYIYPIADYSNNPTTAIAFALGMLLIASPLIHLLYWGLFQVKLLVLYYVVKHWKGTTMSDSLEHQVSNGAASSTAQLTATA